LIAETEEELIKRLNDWKDNVESKGMRVDMTKTKIMISGERQKVRLNAVRWPCGVCSKVLVAIHYSVLAARNGYIRNAVCLQCFDAVGWAAGRAFEWWGAGMVICLE